MLLHYDSTLEILAIIIPNTEMGIRKTENLHFWFTLSVLVLVFLSTSSALNTDGISLLSFKYSVLSDPLSALTTWNYDDETPCSWAGVTCAPDTLCVTGLSLPNRQLLGSISEDLFTIQYLQHLDLSNNFFNGSLPLTLYNASGLQVLSLSNNVVSGELTELFGGLRMLRVLNLSNNALAGKIPRTLSAISNLTVVQLSRNFFYGDIPGGFKLVEFLDLSTNLLNGSLPKDFDGGNLGYLNISYNKFSGEIPIEFAKSLPSNTVIDMSFNNLTGPIPDSVVFLNQKNEAFSGNLGLCGKQLKELCTVPSTLSTPPNITTSTSTPAIAAIPKTFDTTPSATNSSENQIGTSQQTHKGLKPSTIVAIIVGDLAAIGILAIIAVYFYQLRKKRNINSPIYDPSVKKFENAAYVNEPRSINPKSPEPSKKTLPFWACFKTPKNSDEETTSLSSSGTSSPEAKDLKDKRGSIVSVDGETEIELETLLKASAYVLGTSGSSIVYKAVLENGEAYAVRRIGEGCIEKLTEFENQVRIVAKLHHPNLVSVRGFYWGNDEKLVIYDYVNNGSLVSAGKLGSSPYHLSLKVRLKIARGVARGLAYIHEKKHVHGNIKPSNILLTLDMDPVISDFGVNKLVRSNAYKGNDWFGRCSTNHGHIVSYDGALQEFPYNAPETLKNVKANPKWDVYSFGIVLLELLTGKVYLEQDLAQSTITGSMLEDMNRVLRLVEVATSAEAEAREDATLACFKLGFSCASLVPQKRPSMKEALQVLDKIPLT